MDHMKQWMSTFTHQKDMGKKNVSGLVSQRAVKTIMIPWGQAVMEELDDTVIKHFKQNIWVLLAVTFVTGLTESLRTHIQVLQTVPAEGVFAALAQHLCAALVPLDVGATHGALLDGQVRTAVAADPAQTGTRAAERDTCQA